jgi:hypothetical protein
MTPMIPPHEEQESLYYPYTKKALATVRCVFAIVSLGLLIGSCWRAVTVIGLIFCLVIWLFYELVFRSHRRRRGEIISHGRKLTAKIIGKTNDFRKRLSFFLVEYEYQHELLETTVCVPDPLYHRRQIEELVEVIVNPSHPKQCIVLG